MPHITITVSPRHDNHQSLIKQLVTKISIMCADATSQAIGERAHLIGSCAHLATSGDYGQPFLLLIVALQWSSPGNSRQHIKNN